LEDDEALVEPDSEEGSSTDEEEADKEGEEEDISIASEGKSEEVSEEESEGDKNRAPQPPDAPPTGRYIPPAARQQAAAAAASGTDDERVIRRVHGLLNRLAEANMQGIVTDVSELYTSSGRRLVRETVIDCILQAVEEGPRATEQFTAIAAAFMAGLAASLHAQDLLAAFMDRTAQALTASLSQDNSLACSNLANVIAHLFSCGALQAVTVFGLLDSLVAELGEREVSVICALLKACGLQLRGSDPEQMKSFVVKVHARTADKASEGTLSKRAELMMKMIVDVKNNKQAAWNRSQRKTPQAVSKWLRQVGVDEVQLGSLSWSKLADPSNRKGMWWLPQHSEVLLGGANSSQLPGDTLQSIAADGEDGVNLLEMAARQRMSTDVRRAVFCCVMGAEDYMDAFERLMRLPLKAQQEREIVRVVLECCLQEPSFNPYYAALLHRLAAVNKNHKVTLQYGLWDQFKVIETMEPRRATNLARLTAFLLAHGVLSLTLLKVVDFADQMPPSSLQFWRVMLQHTLQGFKQDDDAKDAFTKLAGVKNLEALHDGLLSFIQKGFGPWYADRPMATDAEAARAERVLKRLRQCERILHNAKKVRY